MKKNYVAGFLFDEKFQYVVLIQKEKPVWQKGLLNGVGGKIEDHTPQCDVNDPQPTILKRCNCFGEGPHEAMKREFFEETGVTINNWRRYAELTGPEFSVVFFFANTPNPWAVQTTTNEKVGVYVVSQLKSLHTIPNLQWLIPMAETMQFESAAEFVVTKIQEATV